VPALFFPGMFAPAEELKELKIQVDNLRKRLDSMAPALTLMGFNQDYCQRMECEASVQLMRLKNARIMDPSANEGRYKDNNGMPPCAEMAKWLHIMTDTIIHRPATPTNVGGATPVRREISNRFEQSIMKPALDSTRTPKSLEEYPAAPTPQIGGRPMHTVFVGDLGQNDTFGASPTAITSPKSGGSLVVPQTSIINSALARESSKRWESADDKSAPQTGSTGVGLPAGAVRQRKWETPLLIEVTGGKSPQSHGTLDSSNQSQDDRSSIRQQLGGMSPMLSAPDLRLHSGWTSDTAPQPPPYESLLPVIGQFTPHDVEMVDSTLERRGLALGRGTWATAYKEASGVRRDALRMLCTTGIVTERELADDLTVISEEHIDECVSIATEMLKRWPPKLGPPPQAEAKAFFEERLAMMYMNRVSPPVGHA